MFAAAVHAVKGLFMQQAYEAMLLRELLHDFHCELVVIRGDVRRGEDGRKLVLRGRDLVVLGLCEHAELPKLRVQLLHERRNARLDRAEVVVVQLLPLGRHRAKERAAGVEQVLALCKKLLVHEEIFLLRADGNVHGGDVRVAEELQHAHGLPADGLHGTEERRFFVECLAAVGTEGGGDAEGIVLDEGIGGRVPCGVAARFKGGAQAAGGETGGVRFAAHKLLAGEFHDDVAALDGGNEAVVLFSGDAGHGLEPVGEMRCALFDGPILHGICDHVRYGSVQPPAVPDGVLHCAVGLLREPFLHDRVVEYQGSKEF